MEIFQPPTQEQQDDARIGLITQDGITEDNLVPTAGAPGDGGRGIIEAPSKGTEESDAPFIK